MLGEPQERKEAHASRQAIEKTMTHPAVRDSRPDEICPPAGTEGPEEEGVTMIMDIIKALISLPPSMRAAMTPHRLVRSGTGQRRKTD